MCYISRYTKGKTQSIVLSDGHCYSRMKRELTHDNAQVNTFDWVRPEAVFLNFTHSLVQIPFIRIMKGIFTA